MKIKEMKQIFIKYASLVYPLIGVGFFLLVWYIASVIVGVEMILPTPAQAIARLFTLLKQSTFWLAVLNTVGRAVLSFVLSFVLALVLSIVSYLVPVVAKMLNPIVVILRAVPTMSIILLALIWLDSSTAPILIAFLILFPHLYASLLSSLNGIDKELIDVSEAFKVPVNKRILGLYFPSVLPSALDAMKANISLGIKVTIAGEVLAQTALSMGVFMQISKMYFDTAELLGWTLMAIIVSYLFEGLFELIKMFAVRWKR